jgi:hypothetical protein
VVRLNGHVLCIRSWRACNRRAKIPSNCIRHAAGRITSLMWLEHWHMEFASAKRPLVNTCYRATSNRSHRAARSYHHTHPQRTTGGNARGKRAHACTKITSMPGQGLGHRTCMRNRTNPAALIGCRIVPSSDLALANEQFGAGMHSSKIHRDEVLMRHLPSGHWAHAQSRCTTQATWLSSATAQRRGQFSGAASAHKCGGARKMPQVLEAASGPVRAWAGEADGSRRVLSGLRCAAGTGE